MAEKDLYTLTLEEIQVLTKDIKNRRVNETATGVSFFEGSRRFCKLLPSKKKVALELNVVLPKEQQALEGMTTYSVAEASKKHLGTMRHLYQTSDIELTKKVVHIAYAIFVVEGKELQKKEAEAAKAEKTTSTPEKKIITPNNNTSNHGKKNTSTKGQSGCSTRQLTSQDMERLTKYQEQGKYKPIPPKNIKEVKEPTRIPGGIILPNAVQPGAKELHLPNGESKIVV